MHLLTPLLNLPYQVKSSSPTTAVSIVLSPPGGALAGTAKTVTAIAGLFTYLDLSIDIYGLDYLLRFSSYSTAAHKTLTVTNTLFVSFSAEFSVQPKEAFAGDRVCQSLSISGPIAVCGAPNSNLSVTPIQTVNTIAQYEEPVPEVQIIQMTLQPLQGVQQFHTTAAVGATVGGYFRVFFGTMGPSDPIPSNAVETQMQAYFNYSLPEIGNITVIREPYIFCACDGAFNWTVIFHDWGFGPMPSLSIDASGLTGTGVTMVGPLIVRTPPVLGGSFAIQMNDPNTGVLLTSPHLPFDATSTQLVVALGQLGLKTQEVHVTNKHKEGTRMWVVTFADYQNQYALPTLSIEPSRLTGGGDAWVEVTQPGRLGVNGVVGNFSLTWRGNTTSYLPFNASAAQVKAALQALPVIHTVNVQRSAPSHLHEYTWTIEFVEVYKFTPNGYALQPTTNVEPIVVNNFLKPRGQVNVSVRHSTSPGQQDNPFGPERYGSFGENAGAVYVFSKAPASSNWVEVARLVGNDTAADSAYGSSVSLQGTTMLVGAIGANMNGLPEIQSLYCSATTGSFRLHFRGWSTGLISWNSTNAQLYTAILSDHPAKFANLYSITAISIADWGGGALCHNKTAVITFFAPWYGNKLLLGVDTGGNLEKIVAEPVHLKYHSSSINAKLVVTEVRAGSANLDGYNSDMQQVGAVYIMQSLSTCNAAALNFSDCLSGTSWAQTAQLFPTNPVGGERYGQSVALGSNMAVVGAPGTRNESGVVYVYLKLTNPTTNVSSWSLIQKTSGMDTSYGDNFGHSLAIYRLTMAVGAPFAHDSKGAVYLFNSTRAGVAFALQYILLPASLYTLNPGDLYGYSVAMDNNVLVVGSPGRSDSTIYLGQTPMPTAVNTGAAFVFHRVSHLRGFSFLQKLTGSNVRRRDRFGWSVAALGRTVAVGAVENFAGFPDRTSKSSPSPGPSRAILLIQTKATYNAQHAGTSFRLFWDNTYTRPIPARSSAGQLAYILQKDLNTGPLLVSRTDADQFDGGYVWSVTFMAMDVFNNGYDFVPQLAADGTFLTGTNATITVSFLHPSPMPLRGKTHIFQRASNGFGSLYTEQLFCSPYTYQPVDQCGSAVALRDDYYAMVGCPNRDAAIPNHNTGAAMFYDMSTLKLQFTSYSYTVTEGNTLSVMLQREASLIGSSSFGDDVLLYVQTLDRNSPPLQQLFVQYKFDILDSEILSTQTVLDATGLVGKADGRSNYYGSSHNESSWIFGAYDYRAISDYVPFNVPGSFLAETVTLPFQLVTNDDAILEKPDERVSVILVSPGLWPSILGRFYTSITLLNNNDNYTAANHHYGKLYDTSPASGAEMGHAVAVIDALNLVFASAPMGSNGTTCMHCGHVLISRLVPGVANMHGSDWVQQGVLTSPNPEPNHLFGDAVVAGYRVFSNKENVTLVAVGEPGSNSVHVFSGQAYVQRNLSINGYLSSPFVWEATLTAPQAVLAQHRFGSQGTMALSGCSLLVVGAPGLEAVFLFRRIYHNGTLTGNHHRWTWTAAEMLRSLDFDYDMIYGHAHVHDQEFGRAVAASGRSVAVGAPFADYQKLGTKYVEVNWNTEGSDIVGFGRGKAYMFYSTAPAQTINLDSLQQLSDGYFKLQFTAYGATTTSKRIRFNATADIIQTALGAMNNVLTVSTSSSAFATATGYRYSWGVTFVDAVQEPPLLVPLWHGYGCNTSCPKFDVSSAVPSQQMTVTRNSYIGPFTQVQALSPSDSRDGNRFGWSVALDGDQLVVGAVYSSSVTTTTWDFEVGYLKGWSTTGTAFAYQPTYGDNSRYRIVKSKPQLPSTQQGASGQSSRLTGMYYVGTYELRPGNTSDYTIADTNFPAGGFQGDLPQGTMTSEVFLLLGNTISFLLGGGCDYYRLYVELLVDGMSVEKVTGKCEERMRRVTFNVSMFRSRAAQLRVVDSSSGNWGHISVDDFQFDWTVRGATVNDSAVTATLRASAPPNKITGVAASNAPATFAQAYNGKDVPGGMVESPQSGAAYAFQRHMTGSFNLCGSDKTLCTWSQEAKLLASDKRSSALFGSSLAVSDSAGIIVVGSPNAGLTGYLKDTVPLIHSTSDLVPLPTDLLFPMNSQLAPYFQGLPMYSPENTGAAGVWYAEEQANLTSLIDPNLYVEAGSVYVYAKDRVQLSSTGSVARPQHWNVTEKARLQPPDAEARDYFGGAIAMDGALLVVGSEGQDGAGVQNSGATYVFNVMIAAVSFSKKMYYVIEGTDAQATIIVNRDLNVFAGELVLHYATSDLTAQGIDPYKFTACFAIATGLRGPALCGDYAQTRGLLTIAAGANSASFQVPIVNDNCYERFMKYIQLTLSLPGSSALQGGSTLLATIRIDDDDFLQPVCPGLS